MATYSGRNAKVTLGTNLIGELGEWRIDETADEVDTTAFGSSWKKSDVGFLGWTGSFAGFYDPADAQQSSLLNSFKTGALISNIRFYIDANSYHCPDTTNDANAGCRITSIRLGHTKGGVASVEMTVSGSGPLTLV